MTVRLFDENGEKRDVIEIMDDALFGTMSPAMRNMFAEEYARERVSKKDRLSNAGRPPKYSDEQIIELRRLVSCGYFISEAAREIGMPYRYAWNVIRGYRRADVGDYTKVGFRVPGWKQQNPKPNGIDEPHNGCTNTMYGDDVKVAKLKGPGRGDGHRKFNPIPGLKQTQADKDAQKVLRIHESKGFHSVPAQAGQPANAATSGTRVTGAITTNGGDAS